MFSAVATFAEDVYDELKVAIERDDTVALQLMMKTEVDLNNLAYKANFSRTLSAPIHLAVVKGNIDVIEQLVLGGANLNLTDGLGNTPLHLASDTGQADVVSFLLTHAVQIDQLNIAGESALHLARDKSKASVESLLLAAGALDSEKPAFASSIPARVYS